MNRLTAAILLAACSLAAQDKASQVDEALQLGGVRTAVNTLPAHANEMAVAALSTFPADKRKELAPAVKLASTEILDPNLCYPLVRRYFLQHYDAAHLSKFIVLQRTPTYRTWRRQEQQADLPALQNSRRNFINNLKDDPPTFERRQLIEKFDDAIGATTLQLRLTIAILNSSAAAMGAIMPPDLDTQSTNFAARVRPAMQERTLGELSFTFRNTDDADLQQYIDAAQQPDVQWFNQTLQSAILSIVGDRASAASDYIRAHPPKPFN